jgi:hypothetical protein
MRAGREGCGNVMWVYALVFFSAVLVDSIPVFAPPAWPIMVFLLVKFKLNAWIVILLGVTGTTIGRYILTTYIPWLSGKVLNPWGDENLAFVGGRLKKSAASAFVFVILYSLTPLSTTALFTAAGMGRVQSLYILPPFFLGKLISYSVLILTGEYAATSDLFTGAISWKTVVSAILGVILIGGFLFIDWRELLLRKHFTLKFKIWK